MFRSWFPAVCVAALVLLSFVSGCAEKQYTVLYEIDFAAEKLPEYVRELSGFTSREKWGRWTDANISPTAVIRFDQPLPSSFSLVLRGQSVRGYMVAIVRVGHFEQEIQIEGYGSEAYVDVANDGKVDTIEIIPLEPVSPKSLGINDDKRLLGLGLIELRVER